MNPVKTYLDTEQREQLYSTGLELFRKYGYQRWPKVWERLKIGPFGRNREILFEHLRQLAATSLPEAVTPPAPPVIKIVKAEKPAEKQPGHENALEYDLLKKMRKHRQNRAQISQTFHDCSTDQERAIVCDQLDAENRILDELAGVLAYVRRYGKMPPEPQKEEFILPEKEDELTTLQNRISSLILKTEKRIEYLLNLPEYHKKRSSLPEKQDWLKELQTRRELVKDKLKEIRSKK